MSQSFSTPALIFSIKPLGENNSSVCFFTETEGILYATMYGGHKSKLKSLVSPWNSGIAYFSKSTTTQFLKITDFEPKNYHLSFRQNLYKFWSASLAAELVIKTKCAGSIDKSWTLLNGFLDGLELCKEKNQCTAGLIRFLWRYIDLMGIKPDSSRCSHCGQIFFTSKNLTDTVSYTNKGAVFNPQENSFICQSCTNEKVPFFLKNEALQYLTAITTLTPSQTRLIPLDEEAAYQIKQLVFFLAETSCNSKLKSIETGMGIL